MAIDQICKSAFEENPEKYLGEDSGQSGMNHPYSCGKKPW